MSAVSRQFIFMQSDIKAIKDSIKVNDFDGKSWMYDFRVLMPLTLLLWMIEMR